MKRNLLVLVAFMVLGSTVAVAQANGVVMDGDQVIRQDIIVQPSVANVVVQPTSVLVKPAITVKPADVHVTNPVNHVNVQPAVNNIVVQPADVVIQSGDEWYKKWYVWAGVGVIVAGATAGIVCGTGHCGGGDTTTVNLGGAAAPRR